MIKKLALIAVLVGIYSGVARADTFKSVQMSTTGVLQAGTTGYAMHIGSGTVDNAYASTMTATNLVVTNIKSTDTFTGGQTFSSWSTFSGTRTITGASTDLSTKTFQGAKLQGTVTDVSTITASGRVLNGTQTINSTNTYTGANNFSSMTATVGTISTLGSNTSGGGSFKLTSLAAGSTSGDSLRFQQMKLVQWQTGTLTGGVTRTSTVFSVVGASCTITPTSASNYIGVFAAGLISQTTSGQITYGSIARDAVNIGGTGGFTFMSGAAANISTPSNMLVIDLPGDTSAHIYAPMIRVTAGSGDYCGSGVVCNTFCFELAP